MFEQFLTDWRKHGWEEKLGLILVYLASLAGFLVLTPIVLMVIIWLWRSLGNVFAGAGP